MRSLSCKSVFEVLSNAVNLKIKFKHVSDSFLTGGHTSRLRGNGFTFSKIREYQYGDDPRNIDWNVTAKLGNLYVKEFVEERDVSIVFIIDASSRVFFGTDVCLKIDVMLEIFSVLSVSSSNGESSVSAIIFTDKVEKFIPPKRGKNSILNLITEVFNHQVEEKVVGDIEVALNFFNQVIRQTSIVFLMSDFLFSFPSKKLISAISSKHHVVAIRVLDKIEVSVQHLKGMFHFHSLESEQSLSVDFFSRANRKKLQSSFDGIHRDLEKQFRDNRIQYMTVIAGTEYHKKFLRFFSQSIG